MKTSKQLCAICGTNLATTKDHIPPQSIYPKALRSKNLALNFIPACPSCNNGAAIEDEELKLYIGVSTAEHRDNPDKIIDSLASTIKNNRKLGKKLLQATRNIYTSADEFTVKSFVAVPFCNENISKSISRIIRGLYWMETGKPLGQDSKISIFPFHSMNHEFHKKMSELISFLEPKFLNGKTFTYKFIIDEDGSSIWGMQFFGGVS